MEPIDVNQNSQRIVCGAIRHPRYNSGFNIKTVDKRKFDRGFFNIDYEPLILSSKS